MSRINSEVRNTIHYLFNEKKWTVRKISRFVNVSRKSVRRWAHRNSTTDLPRNVKKVTKRTKKKILCDVKKGCGISQIAESHQMSKSKIYKILRRSNENKEGLFPYKSLPICKLDTRQQQLRLQFLKKMPQTPYRLLEFLKRRIIYDEKIFQLQSSPNKQNQRFWGKNKNIEERFIVKHKHPSKIMVMCGVSYYGKSDLYWFAVEHKNRKGFFIYMFFFFF